VYIYTVIYKHKLNITRPVFKKAISFLEMQNASNDTQYGLTRAHRCFRYILKKAGLSNINHNAVIFTITSVTNNVSHTYIYKKAVNYAKQRIKHSLKTMDSSTTVNQDKL